MAGKKLETEICCPLCKNVNIINLSDYVTQESYDREMGEEIQYDLAKTRFVCEEKDCKNIFFVEGKISEYPIDDFSFDLQVSEE